MDFDFTKYILLEYIYPIFLPRISYTGSHFDDDQEDAVLVIECFRYCVFEVCHVKNVQSKVYQCLLSISCVLSSA